MLLNYSFSYWKKIPLLRNSECIYINVFIIIKRLLLKWMFWFFRFVALCESPWEHADRMCFRLNEIERWTTELHLIPSNCYGAIKSKARLETLWNKNYINVHTVNTRSSAPIVLLHKSTCTCRIKYCCYLPMYT